MSIDRKRFEDMKVTEIAEEERLLARYLRPVSEVKVLIPQQSKIHSD